MNKLTRLDERGVSWKVLLPIGSESRICAIGLDESGLVALSRTYNTIDVKPSERLQYDAVIIGDKMNGDLYGLYNLISLVKPDGVVVNTGRKSIKEWLNSAGFKHSRYYAALPPAEPRLFVPLASRKLRGKGLAFHSPGSVKARVGLTVAKGLNLIGFKRHLMRRTVGIYARYRSVLDTHGLVEWISKEVGYSILDMIVYTGSESSQRKITALAIAASGSSDVIVKIADTELAVQAIRQETQALRAIAASDLSQHAPTLSAEGQWCGYHIQLQEQIVRPNSKQVTRLTRSHFEFLSNLSTMSRKILPLKETLAWQNVKAMAGYVSSQTSPQLVLVTLQKVLSDEFANTPVVCHRTHGDFAPWNIRIHKSKLFVYDWEDSQPEGLALTDVFTFVFRQAALVGPWPGAERVVLQMIEAASILVVIAHITTDIAVPLYIWALQEYQLKSCNKTAEVITELNRILK